jgi:hypothetical protein
LEPHGTFGFSNTDIWFAAGGAFHYQGDSVVTSYWVNWFQGNPHPILDSGQGVAKLWGSSGSNLFGIGPLGTIVHFDGTTWTKMTSGTDIELLDIWGTPDGSQVWTCGYNYNDGRSILLRLNNGNWETLWATAPGDPDWDELATLWADSSEFVMTGGSGLITRRSTVDPNFVRVDTIGANGYMTSFFIDHYPYCLRGSSSKDVFFAGDESMIWHFNGRTWHEYSALHNDNDRLYWMAAKGDMMFAVGLRYGTGFGAAALILRGVKAEGRQTR